MLSSLLPHRLCFQVHLRARSRVLNPLVVGIRFTAVAMANCCTQATDLEVPLYDNNDYDQVILPNGILVTLISDPSVQR